MNRQKRKVTGVIVIITLVSAFFMLSSSGWAKDYPRKPIRIVYPFPAGSGGDMVTRIFADNLSKELGKPVKVSNVTGGKGTIGASNVAKGRNDGYEIGALPIGPAVSQVVFSGRLPYTTSDFEPVCQFTYLPVVLVASTKSNIKTTKELIAYAKENPGKLIYGHPGLGSVPYMMIQALQQSAGIELKGIPFKGLQPGVTAAVGGHVDIALSVAAAAEGFNKAGKLNILGVFAGERMEQMPEVPTLDEDGVKDYPMLWTGIFTPKGVAPDILKRLEGACTNVVKSEAFTKAMGKAKMPISYLNKKDFETKIDSDTEYFKAYKDATE